MRFLALLSLLVSLQASAQEQPKDPAKLSEAAMSEYKAGKFAEAIRDFQAADAARPSPALLFNIAACYEKLADLKNARAAYVEYLRRSPNAEDRTQVETAIASIDARLSQENAQVAPVLLTAPETTVVNEAPPAHSHLLGLVLLGAGAVGLAAGGGLQIAAASQASYPTSVIQTGNQVSADYSTANGLLTGAIIGYGVGGALAIAGAVAFYLESRP
jgi:tetratricopeptide (TPR) repeat protein